MVYGERATPYEVLSEFGKRVSDTYGSDDVLPRMARLLRDGTGASSARIWLAVGPGLQLAAAWPANDVDPPAPATDGNEVVVLGADVTAPVRRDGQLLGALAITKPAGDPPGPSDVRLIEDLARQAGLVLRNASLIADLRASRRRLVAAQDQERRRLERDLHDGAQQRLVAIGVKLRILGGLTRKDPDRAEGLATELQGEAQEALDELRQLARGIYPPLLADRGLSAALESQARKASVPVSVDADGVGRFPPDLEAAVYFSCLEALQNVAKYAEASRASVRISRDDGTLRFEVADDGVGFDEALVSRGMGLQGIEDRVSALGGSVEVVSALGTGTRVIGAISLGGLEAQRGADDRRITRPRRRLVLPSHVRCGASPHP